MGKLSQNQVRTRSSQKGLSCRTLNQSLRSLAESLVLEAWLERVMRRKVLKHLVTSGRCEFPVPWKDEVLVLRGCCSLLLLRRLLER